MADAFVGMIIFDCELVQLTPLGLVLCVYRSPEDGSVLQVSTLSMSIEKTMKG